MERRKANAVSPADHWHHHRDKTNYQPSTVVRWTMARQAQYTEKPEILGFPPAFIVFRVVLWLAEWFDV